MTQKDIDCADSSRETDHQRTEAIEKILVAQRLLREAILILCRSSHSDHSPNSKRSPREIGGEPAVT
jgi:hypothetical protein